MSVGIHQKMEILDVVNLAENVSPSYKQVSRQKEANVLLTILSPWDSNKPSNISLNRLK